MRLAAVVLVVAILLTPTVVVRLSLRRARRARRALELDEIDRVGLRRLNPPGGVGDPTVHSNSPERASGVTPAER